MMQQKIDVALTGLLNYLEAERFQGWEPYEVPELRLLSDCRWHWLRVAWTQLFRISPFYLHAHLTKAKIHAKAAALFAQAFLMLYKISGNHSFREKARFFLQWLVDHRSNSSQNFSIGNVYQLSMKSYGANPGSPAPLITCLAIDAFLSAYEIIGEASYLKLAKSGIAYFLEELPLVKKSPTEWYFVYHPNHLQFIPNIPAVISGTMAHAYARMPEASWLPVMRNNLQCVVQAQQADGSWRYHPHARYTDSFHTAFILEALAKFRHFVDSSAYNEAFQKGLQFYLNTFFTNNGHPRHKKWHGVPSNIDSLLTQIDLRDCAMALILFSRLLAQQQLALSWPLQLMLWTMNHFRADRGFFYYQKIPLATLRGPYLSMQAWMLNALSQLKIAVEQIQS